jgi:hypothetical protein
MKMLMTADNRGMPHLNDLTDETLISQAHRLRLQALQGSTWAGALAYGHEVELRGRLRRSIDGAVPMSAKSKAFTISTAADRAGTVPQLKARAPAVSSSHDTTAGAVSDAMTEVISTLLSNLRELLGMDIALVAEFRDGHRIFRHVDVDPNQPSKLQVGESVPLEGTYCQRVIDGRLPAIIPNTATLPETQELAATQGLGIGAYLSAPVVLANGEVYGTLCCISHQARSTLGCRQADALRSVAALVSAEIEKNRRGLSEH